MISCKCWQELLAVLLFGATCIYMLMNGGQSGILFFLPIWKHYTLAAVIMLVGRAGWLFMKVLFCLCCSECQVSRQTLRKTSSAKEPMRRRGIARMWKAEKHSDRLLAVSYLGQNSTSLDTSHCLVNALWPRKICCAHYILSCQTCRKTQRTSNNLLQMLHDFCFLILGCMP